VEETGTMKATAADEIHFEGVTRIFRTPERDVRALDDFSLECPAGMITAVLGPSGCGKTTLLRMAAGLDFPTKGRVLLDGAEVRGPGGGVGMLSQEGGLLPWRRAAANIELGLEISGISSDRRRARALELLDQVHLSREMAGSYPAELSGGQRQRVALARALAPRPRVLLMDEPFASLDEFTRQKLRDEVIRIWQRHPVTILFVTHSIEEAVCMADRVVTMSGGRTVSTFPISLDRPRDRFGREFLEILHPIRDSLAGKNDNAKDDLDV
jgi:NitT/TauT family transport system ATP-binding protein